MAKSLPLLFTLITLVILPGCGFEPLHGENPSQETTTAHIDILPIADRQGQILHNHLRDLFNPYGRSTNPSHTLSVMLKENIDSTGFDVEGDGSWVVYTLTAHYQVSRAGEQKSIYTNQAVSSVSYTSVNIPYTAQPALISAQEQALRQIAQTLYTDVAYFFRSDG